MEMEEEDNQYMVIDSKIKIFIISMTKKDFYLWLMLGQIQMVVNFL